MSPISLLRHIRSQGYGDNVVFKLNQVASILECEEEEVLTDVREGRLAVKKFGGDNPIQMRVTVNDLLEHWDHTPVFTKED